MTIQPFGGGTSTPHHITLPVVRCCLAASTSDCKACSTFCSLRIQSGESERVEGHVLRILRNKAAGCRPAGSCHWYSLTWPSNLASLRHRKVLHILHALTKSKSVWWSAKLGRLPFGRRQGGRPRCTLRICNAHTLACSASWLKSSHSCSVQLSSGAGMLAQACSKATFQSWSPTLPGKKDLVGIIRLAASKLHEWDRQPCKILWSEMCSSR